MGWHWTADEIRGLTAWMVQANDSTMVIRPVEHFHRHNARLPGLHRPGLHIYGGGGGGPY